MKSLSIKQPFCALISHGTDEGFKTLESRTWPTSHRGLLLLCSSQSIHKGYVIPPGTDWESKSELYWKKHFLATEPEALGHAWCVANVIDCRPMRPTDEAGACCRYYDNLYVWHLADVRLVNPFPVKGRLGLFDVDDSLVKYL